VRNHMAHPVWLSQCPSLNRPPDDHPVGGVGGRPRPLMSLMRRCNIVQSSSGAMKPANKETVVA